MNNFREDDILNYKLSQIRPRARIELKLKDIKMNDKVMLNYNPEEPNEKGLWYVFYYYLFAFSYLISIIYLFKFI